MTSNIALTSQAMSLLWPPARTTTSNGHTFEMAQCGLRASIKVLLALVFVIACTAIVFNFVIVEKPEEVVVRTAQVDAKVESDSFIVPRREKKNNTTSTPKKKPAVMDHKKVVKPPAASTESTTSSARKWKKHPSRSCQGYANGDHKSRDLISSKLACVANEDCVAIECERNNDPNPKDCTLRSHANLVRYIHADCYTVPDEPIASGGGKKKMELHKEYRNLIKYYPFQQVMTQRGRMVNIMLVRSPLRSQKQYELYQKYKDEILFLGISSFEDYPKPSVNPYSSAYPAGKCARNARKRQHSTEKHISEQTADNWSHKPTNHIQTGPKQPWLPNINCTSTYRSAHLYMPTRQTSMWVCSPDFYTWCTPAKPRDSSRRMLRHCWCRNQTSICPSVQGWRVRGKGVWISLTIRIECACICRAEHERSVSAVKYKLFWLDEMPATCACTQPQVAPPHSSHPYRDYSVPRKYDFTFSGGQGVVEGRWRGRGRWGRSCCPLHWHDTVPEYWPPDTPYLLECYAHLCDLHSLPHITATITSMSATASTNIANKGNCSPPDRSTNPKTTMQVPTRTSTTTARAGHLLPKIGVSWLKHSRSVRLWQLVTTTSLFHSQWTFAHLLTHSHNHTATYSLTQSTTHPPTHTHTHTHTTHAHPLTHSFADVVFSLVCRNCCYGPTPWCRWCVASITWQVCSWPRSTSKITSAVKYLTWVSFLQTRAQPTHTRA